MLAHALPRSRRRTFLATFFVLGLLYYLFVRDSSLRTSSSPPVTRPPKHVDTSDVVHDATALKSAKEKALPAFPVTHPLSPSEIIPLPEAGTETPRPIQFDFRKADGRIGGSFIRRRRDTVRDAFIKSWTSYKEHAWMHDELAPLSLGFKDPYAGLAATLVDSLDTLWIMDMKEEFQTAVQAIAKLDFTATKEKSLNLFETTIRHLGGLLSAYDLSGEPILLHKATELGELMYVAFDTPNRMPGFWLNFENARAGKQVAGNNDPAASPGSLSLEFTRLAQLTGDSKFYDAVARVSNFLNRTQETGLLPGVWPVTINFRRERLESSQHSLGGLADSMYEYLPKMTALLNGAEPMYEKMYRRATEVIEEHFLFRPMTPDNKDILFAGPVTATKNEEPRLRYESEHLTCFIGGMFGLGGKLFDLQEHLTIGERLTRGCAWGYSAFPSGLLPEIFQLLPCPSRTDGCEWDEKKWEDERLSHFPAKGFNSARDKRYILRPEAIESVFLLFRMTGNPEYQEMAWTMFEAIRAATETKSAFAALHDVTTKKAPEQVDSMESFWMAETLKYFYLIFSPPELISLDEYVFNTEAHPLKRPI